MRPLFFGLFLFPIFPFLAKAEVTATVDETRPLVATGEIVVENVNGPITIETWDKPEVHLVAVRTARTEADLKALDVVVDSAEKRFTAKTVYLDKDGSWLKKFTNTGEVRYSLTVPHTASLRRIETVNGSISIANAHGRVSAKTVNGRIEARGLANEVDFSTVNDGILAEFDSITEKQDIVLDTVNGSIRLRIPAIAGAEVSAVTLNGSIENDFGLSAVTKKWVGRELEGTIGDGAARIRIKTVNGGIELRKR